MDIFKKKEGLESMASVAQTPEVLSAPESSRESVEQHPTQERVDRETEAPARVEPVSTAAVDAAPISRASLLDPMARQIEGILEEDLAQLFLAMSPDEQQKFKTHGEEATRKIQGLLSQTKDRTKKIFDLIRAWLRMIPKVNRFFLEQEAKIKTDKIKQLKNQNTNLL